MRHVLFCIPVVESTTGKMIVALAIKHSWSKHYVIMSGCATKFTQNSTYGSNWV